MSKLVNDKKLLAFCEEVFQKVGVSKEDAHITSDNLVLSDLRGIPSHGVARLKRYVDGIKSGLIFPQNQPEIEKESPSTATVDGNGGLGQVAGYFGTNLAIKKGKETGVGIVAVRNSNHYGIAGYYSQMILNAGMMGISMTNSAPLVVPTFGKDLMIGTNPISLTAPTKRNRPFFLDMATSVVPRGKLEVYDRAGKPLPEGWAVDARGKVTTDAGEVLKNMLERAGGGILTLGGEGELYSGHKGYGMSLLVDILSGVLSGGAFANLVYAKKEGKVVPPNVCHFFMALKIENFVDLDEFKNSMDDLIDLMKNSAKADGQPRIYIHGEKEYEKYDKYKSEGIPLEDKVYDILKDYSEEFGIPFEIDQ